MENKKMDKFRAMEIVKDSTSKYILVSVGGKRPQLIIQNTDLPDLLMCTMRMIKSLEKTWCKEAGIEFNAIKALEFSASLGANAMQYYKMINDLWVYSKEPSSLDIVSNPTSKYVLWSITKEGNQAIAQIEEQGEFTRATLLMMLELAKNGNNEEELTDKSMQSSAFSLAMCVVKDLERSGAAK